MPPLPDQIQQRPGHPPGANTDTKLLIDGLFQKGRVLAQDGSRGQASLSASIGVVHQGKHKLALH